MYFFIEHPKRVVEHYVSFKITSQKRHLKMTPVVWDTFSNLKFYKDHYDEQTQCMILTLKGELTDSRDEANCDSEESEKEVNIFRFIDVIS